MICNELSLNAIMTSAEREKSTLKSFSNHSLSAPFLFRSSRRPSVYVGLVSFSPRNTAQSEPETKKNRRKCWKMENVTLSALAIVSFFSLFFFVFRYYLLLLFTMRAFLSNYELRFEFGLSFEYHITFRRMGKTNKKLFSAIKKEKKKSVCMFTSSDIIPVYLCLTIFVVVRSSRTY